MIPIAAVCNGTAEFLNGVDEKEPPFAYIDDNRYTLFEYYNMLAVRICCFFLFTFQAIAIY